MADKTFSLDESGIARDTTNGCVCGGYVDLGGDTRRCLLAQTADFSR
jgi:hypothetical protein